MKTIQVVYCQNRQTDTAIKALALTPYTFNTEAKLKVGDRIRSPDYTSPMQVVDIYKDTFYYRCKCCSTMSQSQVAGMYPIKTLVLAQPKPDAPVVEFTKIKD